MSASPPLNAARVVASLLSAHLNLEITNEFSIGSFRDLYALPFLRSISEKRSLLQHAANTHCAAVMMDALLFAHHTMQENSYFDAIEQYPDLSSLWLQFTCIQEEQKIRTLDLKTRGNAQILARSVQKVATMFVKLHQTHELEETLLSLLYPPTQGGKPSKSDIRKSIFLANECIKCLKSTRNSPTVANLLTLLMEHVTLMEMELEFEERDNLAAPHTQHRRGYYEKRSRGTSQTQSNWRKRYFELEGDRITYSKHESGRTSFSRVSDTRERGNVILTAKTHLECVDYIGNFTKRPYCIQIGKGDDALLIQTSSLQDQQDLYEAISSNIRRLGTNRRWIQYPRDTVYGMTLHEFLQYCFLYHGNSSERSEQCAPMQLASRFKVDEKRYLFLRAVLSAFTKDWNGFKQCVISENSESDPNQILSHRSQTPPVIGFGPFLDILELESDPPLSLLHTCQKLYEKFDAKKTAFNTFWSCRNRSEFSDESTITPLATRAE